MPILLVSLYQQWGTYCSFFSLALYSRSFVLGKVQKHMLLLLSRFSCVRLCATHREQPTRLPHPWDSLGKNTGVGCHFRLQCMKVKVKSLSCVRLLATPQTAAHQATPPWDSPGKNTGVGCHFLLQCMKVKVKSVSGFLLLATPWTAAYQAPRPMGFSRQEYWSGLPLPSPIICFTQGLLI